MLFHYHFWTPYVEETEKFYERNGFRISQRIGKYQGNFHMFNPPLEWDDFREKNILFRIIEVRKGSVNITFGYGKKITFDHIGFLVTEKEQKKICENADKMKWEVDQGERRTFITTPYQFRIELQTNKDVVDSITHPVRIQELKLETKKPGLENDLAMLFEHCVDKISSVAGRAVTIKEAVIKGLLSSRHVDPDGVKVLNETV